MKEKNKIGLVIQGPLYSPGRSGANAHISEAELIEEDLVKYNCVHNIIKLFSEFRHQFDEMLFVKWDTDNSSLLESKINKNDILNISDEAPNLAQKKNTILKIDNINRQFYSTLIGLEHLAKKKCTYAIKIRTDQFLDLTKMKLHLLKLISQKSISNHIVVPYFNIKDPDRISDFYFGGETSSLINACKVILYEPRFFDKKNHRDFFYKWAFLFNKKKSLSSQNIYKSESQYTKAQYLAVISAWKKNFSSFPREIFENLIWRGHKFKISFYKNKYLYNDISELEIDDLISANLKVKTFPGLYKKFQIIKYIVKRFIKSKISNLF